MSAAGFETRPTALPGCMELRPPKHADARGDFVKIFQRGAFAALGLTTGFAESYYTRSRRGVVRGLHFQRPPAEHAKLVCCTEGQVQDVALDLRAGSPADDARIQLQIYDNQPASYLKDRPAASIALELQQLDDEEVQGFGKMKNYTFEKQVDKELPPGLYYYVIKREGEDTPLFVGKVEVRKED